LADSKAQGGGILGNWLPVADFSQFLRAF
jgi:hypothetical protein